MYFGLLLPISSVCTRTGRSLASPLYAGAGAPAGRPRFASMLSSAFR